jgi:hypothetical protein
VIDDRTDDRTKEPLKDHLRGSLKSSIDTILWLSKIMIPASAVVFLLQFTGLLVKIARLMEGTMAFLDLPGEAALAVISSITTNLYGVMAMMPLLPLTLRQATILAVVTLVAHSFIVEPAITRKTGTPIPRMIAVRGLGALILGRILSRIIPDQGKWARPFVLPGSGEGAGEGAAGALTSSADGFVAALGQWGLDTAGLVLRIAVIVTVLLFAARWLRYIGFTDAVARRLGWLMTILGLSRESSPAWVVANTLGLTFGAAVLKEESESGRLTRNEGDLLNHHLGISHSILEDTLLFVAIGLPAGWLIVPRFLLAVVVVWERRLEGFLRFRKPASAASSSR